LRLGDELWAVQAPPGQVFLVEQGRVAPLVPADVLLDARLEGAHLGVIFGRLAEGRVQPAFTLWRRAADATWGLAWMPQGQRDWVATDGEIRFAGEGLSALRVRGSSFGLAAGTDALFTECRDCPHRWMVGEWLRTEQGYAPRTALPTGAAYDEAYWEMVELRPYAVLHEFLRRLRAGATTDDLATPEAVSQARGLGLAAPELRLRALEETPEGVRFGALEGGASLWALVRAGRVVQVEALAR
ncbi:MAG: hypothetical protein V1772_10215, partial [Chloroflexota bacterium]